MSRAVRIEEVKSTERYGTNVLRTVHTVTITFRVEGSADAATAAQEVVARFKEQEGPR